MAGIQADALTFTFKADLTEFKSKMADAVKALKDVASATQPTGDALRDAFRQGLYRPGVEELQKSLGELRQQTANAASEARSFKNTWLSLNIGRLVTSGIREGIAAIEDFVKAHRELQDAAKRTGIALSELRGLQKAGDKAGIDGKDGGLGTQMVEFAKKMREAQQTEDELYDLLKKNGIAIKDAAGNAVPLRDIFMQVVKLISEADNEIDKLALAEKLGFDEKAVRVFEQGVQKVDAIMKSGASKADAYWDELARKGTEAWETVKDIGTKVALIILNAWRDLTYEIAQLIVKIETAFMTMAARVRTALSEVKEAGGKALEAVGIGEKGSAAEQGNMERLRIGLELRAKQMRDQMDLARLRDWQENGKPGTSGRAAPDAPTPPPRPKGGRAIKGLYDDDDSGGGKERADAVERYLQNLERSKQLLQQEVELWGRSRTEVEAAKALEGARAAAKKENRDLTEEETQKARKLGTEYGQVKDRLEQLRDIQQSINQLAQTFTSALQDWIVNGNKFSQVAANLAKSLANMSMEALLMGKGPLAELFGTKAETKDGLGGLLGGLFKSFNFGGIAQRASGGPIAPNGWSWVGENGPELIRAGSSGASVLSASDSASAMGGGGPGQIVVTVNGARGNQEINSMVQQGVTVALREYDRRAPAREQERMLRFA